MGSVRYCTGCGAQVPPDAAFCPRCGIALHGATLPPPPPAAPPPGYAAPPPPYYAGPPHYPPPGYAQPPADSGLSSVFPYKNGKALAAYYLGCFSFIIPLLAIPAVIYGILGWNAYRDEPRLKGAAHAWIGIAAATLAVLLWAMMVYSLGTLGRPFD
jgi:hypothetical protein